MAPDKVTAETSQSPPVLASYLREKLLSIAPELEVKPVIGSPLDSTPDLSQEFWSSIESKVPRGFSTQ